MWVNSSRIAHVVDSAAKERFHRCSKVEGNHTSCYCSHTGRLHTCCRCFVRFLGFELITGAIAAESYRKDSSASISTRTGCHCIV